MALAVFRVFLSAVSSEFKKARSAIASDLRARGIEVKEQEDFRQEADADTLLRKLHNYIMSCSAVVCIVGRRTGSLPPEAAVQDFKAIIPPGLVQISYTQSELLFARHYRKRLSLYIANADYLPDQAMTPDPESNRLQEAFLAHLHSLGLDYSNFSTVDQLCRHVLKEDWPSPREGAAQAALSGSGSPTDVALEKAMRLSEHGMNLLRQLKSKNEGKNTPGGRTEP